ALRPLLPRRAHEPRVRHRHGALDRPRTAGRRARPGLGGELSRGRRALHDRRAGRAEAARGDRVTPSARILLVDDEVSIQRTLAPLLRSRGYDVDVAATGADALKAASHHPPDLIVLDLGLPDLEGSEVCRRIRTSATMPIIILSARSNEKDKVAALDLGADDYVTKPFGPEELLARIRVWLRRMVSDDRAENGRLTLGALTID